MTVEGQTCVVTGSSRGIGRATAERFGELGANVVVNYRSSRNQAEQAVETIESSAGSAIACKADVTDAEAVETMRTDVHDAFGPIDVLVNNAGITSDQRFEKMTRTEWQRVIDVNLTGMFITTSAFFEDLANASHGRLINVASVMGQRGNFGQANYAASKSGVMGFTKTLAIELGRHDTTANAVAPGFIDTDMLAQIPDDVLDNFIEQIPLGRLGKPREVAAMVTFLASERSSYITGQVLPVNGGMYR
jgi:3-oxoacyl-[acyl-carrier protein] reductase